MWDTRPTLVGMLEDGSYDAVVVDAEPGAGSGSIRLELAIAAGPHKGEVVPVSGIIEGHSPESAILLLGLPATLTVIDSKPTVTIDD